MTSPNTCGITSITSLLSQASAGSLNITSKVDSCPNVCTLAWGSGNPDLSGIGANASYIMQAILTFLCGIILCIVYELRGSQHLNLSDRTVKHISSLHDTFLDINAQFSVPVAVAAVVRFRQHATFYELAFLRALTTMQFMSFLSVSVTSGLFNKHDDEDSRSCVTHGTSQKGNEPRYKRSPMRVTVIVLYGILQFGFYIGLIKGLTENVSSWTTINELSTACVAYGHIFPWSRLLHVAHVGFPSVSAPRVASSKTSLKHSDPLEKLLRTRRGRFIGAIFGILFAAIVSLVIAVYTAFYIGYAIVYGLLTILRAEGPWRVAVIPISLAFAIAMLVELAEMEKLRNIMKTIAGDDFEDNQWGFGQIIALFLWVPLIFQLIYTITQYSTKPKDAITSRNDHRQPSPSDEAADGIKDGNAGSAARDDVNTRAICAADDSTKDEVHDKIKDEADNTITVKEIDIADAHGATIGDLSSLLGDGRVVEDVV